MSTQSEPVPRGNMSGFAQYFAYDFKAGFLVFLIALPLCLGISIASGFPPLAGIFTAIIGSLVASIFSNSELTIKGPAAGLIVIILGCFNEFGGDATGAFTSADMAAYKAALAVSVAAAILQIFFGIVRLGVLGEFFPSTVVHGMLAAIGVIIMAKQFPVALGVSAKGDPLDLIRRIPEFVKEANPHIAVIGVISILLMFLWPVIGSRFKALKVIPSPVIVLAFAIPMGLYFDLIHDQNYSLFGHEYQTGEKYLVEMPNRIFGMFDQIAFPDFSALQTFVGWKWVLMFFLIGSLESMLSAKAVDLIDPWKRKTSLDRDVLGVGVANLCASMVGGLPMISEIVRSRANIDNGARTRFADVWHGVFLLACVARIPMFLHRIPLAALAAMLVFTGFRLAHPREFIHVYHIGKEQFLIFVVTLVGVLATDLLWGVVIGIVCKMMIHVLNGVPLKSLFKPYLEVEPDGESHVTIRARESAVFSNWIPFRRQLVDIGLGQRQNISLDMTNTHLVDHSVMQKLEEMQQDFEQEGLKLEIIGLGDLAPIGKDKLAARKGRLAPMKKLTIVADSDLEDELIKLFQEQGATGYTLLPCRGASWISHQNLLASDLTYDRLWFEVIVPEEVCHKILDYMRQDILPKDQVIATVTNVEVVRRERFLPSSIQHSGDHRLNGVAVGGMKSH